MSDPLLVTATTVKTAGACTAVVNGIATTVQVARDLTVAVGDVLLVSKVGSQWFAVQRFYVAAPAGVYPEPVPEPKPAVVTGTLVVLPASTGTFRDGKWRTDTTDVMQGAYGGAGNATGAAFYGVKPRSLAGATVTSASIRVHRGPGGTATAIATTLRLVAQSARPPGAPTLGATTAGPALAVNTTATAVTIPAAWAQAMVDGTSGGLAIYDATGAPYVRWTGRDEFSAALQLSILWTR